MISSKAQNQQLSEKREGEHQQNRGESHVGSMKSMRIRVRRHQRLVDLLEEREVDICTLQEARIAHFTLRAFVEMAKRRGFQCSTSNLCHIQRQSPVSLRLREWWDGPVANFHSDCSCKESIRDQVCNARAFVVIGDCNLIPEEGVVSEALAKGCLELPETECERQQPARTRGRHIDHMPIN